jgi:phosphatidylglycerol:prolipoprotein diacylglycerol transferase
MRQVLFIVPGLGLKVPSFSLMLLLACLTALALAARRARRAGLDPAIISDLAVWLFTGGFLGARVLFLVQHPESVQHWSDVVKVWQGGIVFYGCIAGGLIGSLLYWVRNPFPFRATADAVAPALALGIAVGRLGCFLNGCCYGSICNRPWAVRFPAGTLPWVRHVQAGLIPPALPHSLPVHPKQLYLALAGLALLALLSAYSHRKRRDGEVMVLLMIAYPLTRFVIEFFRGDAGGLVAGWTISQYISAAVLACGLAAWLRLPQRPVELHADPARRADPAVSATRRARGTRVDPAAATLPRGEEATLARPPHRPMIWKARPEQRN